MKKHVLNLFLVVLLASGSVSAQQVEWMSWEEAVALAESGQQSKKIFVDVYTDWCGWCKRMDKDTFQNPEVAAYMRENFLMVKLDAEQQAPIVYKGKTFSFVPQGRRGYHELAAALLQGRLSYPTVVFLDENLNMLSPVPGYQQPEAFMKIARYFGDNIYKDKDWQTYSGSSR
ncbi:thioredoxin family protein [Robiginitalea sediminis]|uniref:thioredoxin family protein n=1 Tax=Robiginitalea sediminis TaxID=1982593 RepID=UPI000B4A5F3D|nr:DUF255 domain-containing protein [Robiginitalea sediminis]